MTGHILGDVEVDAAFVWREHLLHLRHEGVHVGHLGAGHSGKELLHRRPRKRIRFIFVVVVIFGAVFGLGHDSKIAGPRLPP